MQKLERVGIAVLVLAAQLQPSLSDGVAGESSAPAPRATTILVIGDSLVSRADDNWVAQLGAKSEALTTVAKAHPGWATTSFLKPRLEGKAFAGIDPGADLVLLLMGSNDIRQHGHSDETIAAAVWEGLKLESDTR